MSFISNLATFFLLRKNEIREKDVQSSTARIKKPEKARGRNHRWNANHLVGKELRQ